MNNNLNQPETRYQKNERLEKGFPAYARDLANALGGTLQPSNNPLRFAAIDVDGTRLHFWLDGYTGKIQVTPGSANNWRGQYVGVREVSRSSDSLTVSINIAAEGRSFDALAADVRRRILPGATEIWNRIQASISRDLKFKQDSEKNTQVVLAACGGAEVHPLQNGSVALHTVALEGVDCVEVSADVASFKVNCTPDRAAKILQFIRSL